MYQTREAGSGSCFNELSPDWEGKHTHRLEDHEETGEDVNVERKLPNEEAQYGEIRSEFQRTLRVGSYGREPEENRGPDKIK